MAADLQGVPTLFGPVAAAFGPAETQGRGSLRSHILVWLLQASMHDILKLLQRNEDRFKDLLEVWMREVVQAVVACQHTAVTEFPTYLQGGSDTVDIQVPPLPYGPTERRNTWTDGARETGTPNRSTP